jgi:secondary thiamine-phosphate synthase enzyme
MSVRTVSRSAPSSVTVNTVVTSVLTVRTSGHGFVDLTREVEAFLQQAEAREGMVTAFIRHTSASLTIQENADPSVLHDLTTALSRLAPENAGWTHDAEGPDDMPGHVKTMLTSTSLQVPVRDREMMLGTWQALYLIEHRSRPHTREVVLQFIGSTSV